MDRLTNIIRPKKIFMGEKDFQQLFLVKKYIENKYKSRIISCKTIRDNNKLALSSRNLILKKNELKKAAELTVNLITFKKRLKFKKKINKMIKSKKESLEKNYNIKIEYLELRNKINLRKSTDTKNSNLFFAYHIKNIRLIDNI